GQGLSRLPRASSAADAVAAAVGGRGKWGSIHNCSSPYPSLHSRALLPAVTGSWGAGYHRRALPAAADSRQPPLDSAAAAAAAAAGYSAVAGGWHFEEHEPRAQHMKQAGSGLLAQPSRSHTHHPCPLPYPCPSHRPYLLPCLLPCRHTPLRRHTLAVAAAGTAVAADTVVAGRRT
ncbi:unnamed protein product, partial [Closterium sp. NIES-54]